MDRRAKLQELKCSKMNILPGDKILVRTKVSLSVKQVSQMRKAIEQWAGDGVPVIFINEDVADLRVAKPHTPFPADNSKIS